MLISEESQPARAASAQMPGDVAIPADPKELLRDTPVGLQEVSSRQAVRHDQNLSCPNILAYQRWDGAGTAKARAA